MVHNVSKEKIGGSRVYPMGGRVHSFNLVSFRDAKEQNLSFFRGYLGANDKKEFCISSEQGTNISSGPFALMETYFMACAASRSWRLFALACVLCLTAGCAAQEKLPVAASDPDAREFPLNPGDKIHLTVYEEERMTGDYTVDESGKISVPLVGAVEAEGTTKSLLQNRIAGILQNEGLYKDPHVTVDIASLRPFYILGEVNKPGAYPYMPSLDVFSAVALAGGYTARAATNGVIITRIEDGKKTRLEGKDDSTIAPGDSILVRQRYF
jgi:protein involved in polysaccharide export with SLBB domain